MFKVDVIEHLVAAEKAREEMLGHLTTAANRLDHIGSSGSANEARNAVAAAKDCAWVDGSGGPLPGFIVAALLAVARLGLDEAAQSAQAAYDRLRDER